MTVSTLIRYLVGSPAAIVTVATSRWSLAIGAIFVLSAGLAREYDGEDLVHEPWHALRPLAASLVSGTTLFLLVHVAALLRRRKGTGTPPPFSTAYRAFLGLFWMTAPMAWLYAIPYERFMSPVDAVEINLWTLAIVAAWRVALMTRVIQVIYGIGSVSAFFLVMLFADVVLFTVLSVAPAPIIDVMGGIRSSGRDALIAAVTLQLTILAVLTAPIWGFGALVVMGSMQPRWLELRRSESEAGARGLLILAAASILIFLPFLFVTQPEQIRRREAENLMLSGRIPEALALMSARQVSDFPPQWNPPPKLGYHGSKPSMAVVQASMAEAWPADWVADIYLAKSRRRLERILYPYASGATWNARVRSLLDGYEYTEETIEAARPTIAFLLEHDDDLPADDRAPLRRLLEYRPPDSGDGVASDGDLDR